jgi:hypothetical protein
MLAKKKKKKKNNLRLGNLEVASVQGGHTKKCSLYADKCNKAKSERKFKIPK